MGTHTISMSKRIIFILYALSQVLSSVECRQTKDGTFSTFCCFNVTKFRSMENPKSEYSLGIFKPSDPVIDDILSSSKNITDDDTCLSIAPYQDSSTACVFYNIFAYLILVILVLAAVALAV